MNSIGRNASGHFAPARGAALALPAGVDELRLGVL
jgi:hypothetical protein